MSFRKRTPAPKGDNEAHTWPPEAAVSLPAGVRTAPSYGTPITSWGLRSIDAALGGGLPIGSITVVIEDEPSAYHVPLVSYVTAQGLQFGHAVAVVSFATPATSIVEGLPACVQKLPHVDENKISFTERRNMARMEIAWRYQKNADPSTHIVSGDSSRSFASDFDLSQKAELPRNAPVSCLGRGVSGSMDELLEQLSAHLDRAAKQNLLSRIVIHGLSPAYFDGEASRNDSIATFLCRLRSLTRVYGAVAVISCVQDLPYRIASAAADAVLRIDSFGGRGAGVAGLGKEWLGVVIVRKTFRDGRASSLRGKGDVWVFKRGRRKYVMERATAAPDEDDEPQGSEQIGIGGSAKARHAQPEDEIQASNVCGSRPGTSQLDF